MINNRNAIIMAAGMATRFDTPSSGQHKAFITIDGQTLIDRQIEQLSEAGVTNIIVVTGYLSDQFEYLASKYDVRLIHNPDYKTRNNNSSIWTAREYISDSYICSCDNYFPDNPFCQQDDSDNSSYYSALYADGHTNEWCMTMGRDGYIDSVSIGGENAWYMMGHSYWNKEFSSTFLRILECEYDRPDTAPKLWEQIYSEHLDMLKMRIRKYPPNSIYEFDTECDLASYMRTIVRR